MEKKPKMPRPQKPAMVTMIALGAPKSEENKLERKPASLAGGRSMRLGEQPPASGEIPLEAVGFRSEEQVCGNCAHYGRDGCALLPHAPCTPGASCAAWKEGEAEQYQDVEPPLEGEGDEQ